MPGKKIYTIPVFQVKKKQGSEWLCGLLIVTEEVEN